MKTDEITALIGRLDRQAVWAGETERPNVYATARKAATALRSLLAEREAMRGALRTGKFTCEECGTRDVALAWARGLDMLLCPNCSGAD